MRLIAIILNIGVLLFLIFGLLSDIQKGHADDLLIFILVFTFLIINIIALWKNDIISNNWIALYLKRKAMEEKHKIEKLNSETDRTNSQD